MNDFDDIRKKIIQKIYMWSVSGKPSSQEIEKFSSEQVRLAYANGLLRAAEIIQARAGECGSSLTGRAVNKILIEQIEALRAEAEAFKRGSKNE